MEAYKDITDSISNWLNDYSQQSGLGTYVVGVSGGIDSALVSTLCALTGRPTHVFNIPIKSSQKNTALSTLHCEWLVSKHKNVHVHNINLSDTYDSFISSVVDVTKNEDLERYVLTHIYYITQKAKDNASNIK